MPTTTARRVLRDLLNNRPTHRRPGVFDGICGATGRTARLPAAYLTGAGVAASGFGLPDIGLITQTEMAERAGMLVGAAGDIPVIADADTGYGAPINVVRTVRAYEARRSRRHPARRPGLSQALRASRRQRSRSTPRSSRQTLQARARHPPRRHLSSSPAPTPAAPLGFDAAIARANRYATPVRTCIFVEAPQGIDEIERIAARGRRRRC